MPTKKLIEVALPLDDINAASAREKSIRHGHPSTLHLWWARRPLAACRAVLFASLIDDPDQEGVPAELLAEIDRLPAPELPDWRELPLPEQRRLRLFRFIKLLVQWESSNDERVLTTARRLIHAATGGNPPPVYDPFAGGGSIPLEAQRLGLEAHASDLNPVAVLINKALIEIPPKFANMPPVNPVDRNQSTAAWKGAAGLAADVRYYGKWMRDEAERRIGHLYPKVRLPKEYGGGEVTVIAWLWARTVTCPNPACGATMPLAKSFLLAGKKGQSFWVEPTIDRTVQPHTVQLQVRKGDLEENYRKRLSNGTAFVNDQGKKTKAAFGCIVCNASIVKGEYIDNEANHGRMGVMPLAIVAEGDDGRLYVDFTHEQATLFIEALEGTFSQLATEGFFPEEPARGTFASNAQGRVYGFQTFSDYFTKRQLVVVATFSRLVLEARDEVMRAAFSQGDYKDPQSYADAIATYLAMCVSRFIDRNNTLCSWDSGPLGTRSSTGGSARTASVRGAFARQGLAMTWDFAESSPFSHSGGGFTSALDWIVPAVASLNGKQQGRAIQQDASTISIESHGLIISTDPPYYGNVGYADLSDFFYVWLRRSTGKIYRQLFNTLLVPKGEEITAIPWRFDGDRQRAREFFEETLGKTFARLRYAQHPYYPLTVFYAFKQSETDEGEEQIEGISVTVASTGWETMLEGLIQAGFEINGTWPMRTELAHRSVGIGTNALASSIVLVCRPRPEDVRSTTRLEFIRALRRELPSALRALQRSNIAPVDLAQAAIGPGMAIYSRYRAVLEADGSPMRVRTALQLINQALDEVLAEQEGEYDGDTRWAIAWFEQSQFAEGAYGVAETLSKAKNTSVAGMVEAGVIRAGKVRLISRDELPASWDPGKDERVTAWEATQHLVRALDKSGESGAAAILAALPGAVADQARDLAYRLYTTCERKKWAQEALAYNSLVIAWPEIAKLAVQRGEDGPVQHGMFE